MSADIKWYAGTDFNVNDTAGSGLGFYGAGGFGASIAVGAWQDRTFITNAAGTAQGPEADNCKYLNPTGVILGQSGSGILLTQVPNYLSTVNPRFTYDAAVKTQNVKLYIYDRVTPASPASGVTTAVAEIVHPDNTQANNGSGSSAWQIFSGGVVTSPMTLTASPGTSGLRPSGSSTTDARHDWYLALSSSPDAIGSHTQYGAYLSLEYL
jgi:hypothetical protein